MQIYLFGDLWIGLEHGTRAKVYKFTTARPLVNVQGESLWAFAGVASFVVIASELATTIVSILAFVDI